MAALEGERDQSVIVIAERRNLARRRAAEHDGMRHGIGERGRQRFARQPTGHEQQDEARSGIRQLAADIGDGFPRIAGMRHGDTHRFRGLPVKSFPLRRHPPAILS